MISKLRRSKSMKPRQLRIPHAHLHRGQKHVVRYKVMSVETIPKNLYDWNDW